MITGVYPPTAGEHSPRRQRIDGQPPPAINRAGIARTFQNIRLFQSLSVLDNVDRRLPPVAEPALTRTLLRTPRFFREHDRREARRHGAASRRWAWPTSRDYIAQNLPYGDQRRLEIARALATRPKILLLDEPAAGMNPQEKVELMDLIRFIRDQFGVGILLIEHDMKLVMSDLRADHRAGPRRDDRRRDARRSAVESEGDRGVPGEAGVTQRHRPVNVDSSDAPAVVRNLEVCYGGIRRCRASRST